MQIKSDETPKTNRLQELLKKNKTNEILGVATKGTLVILLLVVSAYILNSIKNTFVDESAKKEKEMISQIKTNHPILKRYTEYFLPDEYDVIIQDGVNMVDVHPKGLSENTYYLTNIKVLINKENTNNFRQAVYKKRGITTNDISATMTQKVNSIKTKQKDLPSKGLDNGQSSSINQSSNDFNVGYNYDFSLHTYDYYERKRYANGYNPLVESYKALKTYKLTEEYKSLKRFERTKELEKLNANYNKVRPDMWKLHYKFGLRKGSFDELQQGKLKVDMVEGKLIFSHPLKRFIDE